MIANDIRFEEKIGILIEPAKDGDSISVTTTEGPYLEIYATGMHVGLIRPNGDVTYGACGPNLKIRCVRLSTEQRQQVDAKAREFLRKCSAKKQATAEIPESEETAIWRFESGKKMIWETRCDEEGGLTKQEVLAIFFGRDEVGFINTDGKITLRGTWDPEEFEYLAKIAAEYRAREPHRKLLREQG